IPDRGGLPAGLPIALDVGAGVGALAWITEKPGAEARKWGRTLALAALALSLAGNGVAHGIGMGLVAVNLPLVLAVGGSIPLVLFGVIHLAALMARPAGAAKSASRPPAKPSQKTKTVPKAGDPEVVESRTDPVPVRGGRRAA